MINSVQLNAADNVVTAIAPIAPGNAIEAGGSELARAVEAIPIYHKASIADISKGAPIRKYGQTIGVASADIPAGSHVHTQNLVSESDYRGDGK